MKWQPINTAPRDRTHVLLFTPNDEPQVVVGYFESYGGDGWWTYSDLALQEISEEIVEGGPTHWMPLPLPPA